MTLGKLSATLYTFESIGSVVLAFHGLLGLRAVEHSKSLMTMKFLAAYSKVAFVTYLICSIIYFVVFCITIEKVFDLAGNEMKRNFGTWFGDFLGVFIEKNIWGGLFTGVVIIAIIGCFI
jgi:hypothetical protein